MKYVDTPFDLTGKSALITGGGTGLGRFYAKQLAEAGARVVLCARRVEKLQDCAKEINANGGTAECYPMDVTDIDSIQIALENGSRNGVISIVVNNAGVFASGLMLHETEDEWDAVMATNLKGAWLVAREAVARMSEAKTGGSIINISSMLGIASQKGTAPYGASKAALLHLTRNMALEWAKFGVRTNAIAPGSFSSDMADEFLESDLGQVMLSRIPLRRFGNHADLAGPILLLASNASAFLTGVTLPIDGGHTIRRPD